jgi:probable F420-dependent oxidoreductase
MQIGAIFPQTEIGPDAGSIREYVQAVEEMQFDYLFIADHVLGADPDHHQHVQDSYYTHHSVIHESLTTLAFISAITTKIRLVTGILILPQRQTALVAKQAAEIDVLSGGRLTLGIGVGWNHVEFEALGEDFSNRGVRSEEQINLMRALWTQDVVDFDGRWHSVRSAGIKPLPVQRPIPVWFGAGGSAGPVPRDVVLRRIARMGDGWFPSFGPDDTARAVLGKMETYIAEAGRQSSDVGLAGRLRMPDKSPEEWLAEAEGWRDLGATHIMAEARRGPLSSVAQHIEAMQQFREVIPVGWGG